MTRRRLLNDGRLTLLQMAIRPYALAAALTSISAAVCVSLALPGCASSKAKTSKLKENSTSDHGDSTRSSLIPLRDFFRNQDKTAFALSPDGKMISYLAPWKGRMNLFVEPRDKSTDPLRVTSVEDRDLGGQFWKGNRALVYTRDFNGDENYQLFSVNLDTNKTTALTPFTGVRANLVDPLEQIDDNQVIVEINRRKLELFDAYRLNVHTGELTLIAENPGHVEEWITDHKGRLRAAIDSDGVNKTLLVRDSEKSPFKKLFTTNFKEHVTPLFYTFDNRKLFVTSDRGRDKAALVSLDLKTGKETPLFEHPEVDIDAATYSKRRHVLLTALYQTDRPQRHFFDREIEDIFADLKERLPDQEINLTGNDDSERLMLVRASSDVSRGAEYIYDTHTKKLEKLADFAPWLEPSKMAPMKAIEYKTRDGLTIHGYLTLPLGKEAQNLPVIINPHGGPWARDTWGFRPEVQFLASRGYAVLQMNYRGSTGYGRKFWEASFKEWGRKMQDDISDGVKWVTQEKIGDQSRIAIYGGSYGGYATLAGLSLTPQLYKCGIDYVGVSNLFTFLQTIPPYWKPYLDELYEMVGDPIKDKALLTAASPVFHVDQIRAPLFVAQGAKDPRVNINESNQIVDALRKRGVAVKYMIKDNEGHGFHDEENRFDFYEAMQSFLSQNL